LFFFSLNEEKRAFSLAFCVFLLVFPSFIYAHNSILYICVKYISHYFFIFFIVRPVTLSAPASQFPCAGWRVCYAPLYGKQSTQRQDKTVGR
jgi:hypothetical protein